MDVSERIFEREFKSLGFIKYEEKKVENPKKSVKKTKKKNK